MDNIDGADMAQRLSSGRFLWRGGGGVGEALRFAVICVVERPPL